MLGLWLGPVHRSIGPVEMLPRVHYKTGHVTISQRVQYSCVLDQAILLLQSLICFKHYLNCVIKKKNNNNNNKIKKIDR